jgi:DnaJ family protein A protein 5
MAPRVNFYKVLGLKRNTNLEEIKRTYRKLILLYHPDKNTNKNEDEQKEAEFKFIKVQEAYEYLLKNHKDLKPKQTRQKKPKQTRQKKFTQEKKSKQKQKSQTKKSTKQETANKKTTSTLNKELFDILRKNNISPEKLCDIIADMLK